MKRYFDKEQYRAFAAIETAIVDHQKRTVSIHDIAVACGRENDPRWMTRIQNLIPEYVEALAEKGIKAVAVNLFCTRHYTDTPVTDPLVAIKCVQLRGGGAPAAGIRRVVNDGDRVLDAHMQSLMDLGCASVTGVLHNARQAEAHGYISERRTEQWAVAVTNRITSAASLPPTPEQQQLIGQSGD